MLSLEEFYRLVSTCIGFDSLVLNWHLACSLFILTRNVMLSWIGGCIVFRGPNGKNRRHGLCANHS